MSHKIVDELKEHSPFTLFGAMAGIVFMMVFKKMPHETAHHLFYIFHPAHVFLSAMVTTSLFCHYTKEKRGTSGYWLKVLLIGFIGSVGIGTLSDSLLPFLGEALLDMPQREVHIGIIEKWWLISAVAVGGVWLGYYKPSTKFPHAGHVLISTWASLFHMLMAADQQSVIPYFGVFIFLFLGVWIPCCLSDVAFPLLFVSKKNR